MKNEEFKNKNKRRSQNGFYISAVKRNSGKTTISIALTRILRDKGFSVQPFKKGPDFIDPMWLSRSSGNSCYNLDFYFMSREKVKEHFANRSLISDISVVEGNHGLHDSFDVRGRSSNAEMSKLLGLPVILIVDVAEMNRGVVPLLLGFKDFDKDVDIKGVMLNKVHSGRHEKNLLKAIKYYTDFEVAGCIPKDLSLSIKQRHLGLFSTLNDSDIENHIVDISSRISSYVDTGIVLKISGIEGKKIRAQRESIIVKESFPISAGKDVREKNKIKIGIAFDRAFNFYYNENIEAIEKLGCEIIRFSPLNDARLPEVDAVYIGGGFPEILCGELENNRSFRKDLKDKIECGLPVYAECGGLMYLCKAIYGEKNVCEMVGIIDADVKLTKKPKGHGYTKLSSISYDKKSNDWFNRIRFIKGHEFHHSFLEMSVPDFSGYSFNVIKGFGVDGNRDGISYKNTYAAYTHVYSPSSPGWFKSWISFVKKLRKTRQKIKQC